MDLKEKLKYYSQTSQIQQKTSAEVSEVSGLANKFKGILKDGVIKICHYYPYSHFIPAHIYPENVYLPTLTKQQITTAIPVGKSVVFDLETTGLAGGTGTYPFLIGFGYPETNGVNIVQYFLPDFGREAGAYLDMKEDHAGRSILISYNGKSFDYPLLRNRMILNRIDNSLASMDHLDLLHLSRRIWRNMLTGFSLQTIEEKIFYFSRIGDIEGMLIPQSYFNFLQSGHTDEIHRIIQHNRQDILTLVRLLFYLHRIEERKTTRQISETELLNLFKLANDTGDIDEARRLFQVIQTRNIDLSENLVISYSRLLKHHRCWEELLPLWHKILDRGAMVPYICEEFAKYYEHISHEYHLARMYIERALQHYSIRQELYSPDPVSHEFERRYQRIMVKLLKKG